MLVFCSLRYTFDQENLLTICQCVLVLQLPDILKVEGCVHTGHIEHLLICALN